MRTISSTVNANELSVVKNNMHGHINNPKLLTCQIINMAIIGNFAIVLIVPYIHCLVDLAVRQATTPITRFGESLSWDSEKQAIYLVDVLGSTVYQHVYGSNATTSTKIDSETIGAAIPIRDRIGEFIVPANQDVLKLEWDGTHDTGKVTKLNINFEFANNEQFYSAKADAKGRLWVGTYQVINREKYEFVKGGGSLYMITIKENSVEIEKKLSNLTFPTGLDWTSDNRFMYHADITERKIKKYTFDIDSGDLGDWEVFFDLADHPHLSGSIDGLIVKNNLVTFALYHGSALVDVDQDTRKIIYVVPTPVPQHTSLVVGGPHLDTVYVASSDFLLTEDEKQLNPFDSQAVFAYTGLRYWGVASHKVSLR